jgi:hypothetical protein
MKACGAKTRNGTPCKRPGMENGRCKLHGGASLKGAESATYKHGRTSRYTNYLPAKIKSKVDTFEDSDALDLQPELQVQRALFADYLMRFEVGMQLGASDIALLMQWSAEIGKSVERIVKMRNESALTAAEMAFIAARIPDVVSRFIDDPDKQRAFISELLGIVGAGEGDAQQLESITGRAKASGDRNA